MVNREPLRPMPRLIPWLLLPALLTGCGAFAQSSTPDATETAVDDPRAIKSPEHFASMQGRLEQLVPSLRETSADAGVELEVRGLADSSCLGPEIKEQQERTRWEGLLRGDAVNPETANAALDQLSVLLQEEGWTLVDETNHPERDTGEVRSLAFVNDGLSVSVLYDLSTGSGPGMLDIVAATRCVDHPTDHQMLRSTLDPHYGQSDEHYLDGE
ncbi:hypothetical protein ACFFON_11185 [Arthrobacter citreus]|uniref:hypothetical protein n=1 Tax=Arthrobacter TaxID=1663 RepID=UPI00126580C0|nr:hypothetical protein [Arthrobacter gandavensis]